MINTSHLNRKPIIKYLLFLVLISFLLSGCAALVGKEQPEVADWGTLSAGQTIGQTFVANYDGLAGIYFYLSPQEIGTGEIRLHLRSSPQAADDLAVSMNTLPVETVKAPGYFGFFVPAQASSNQKYYYAFLEVIGSGKVQVGKAWGSSYLYGALYQNGTPEDAQTAFQLSYSRRKAALGLAGEAATWVGILAVGFFLFILPGWGLLSLLWPGWGRMRWTEKLGLSAGLSLAFYPLLMLWTDLIGLHLGAIYAWLPPLAGLGLILWRNRRRFNVNGFRQINLPKAFSLNLSILPDIALLIVLVLIVFTRFWVIRSLNVPLNSDSYQHTIIAQLLVDHGGLFSSWQPYADLVTFTYHFGFHSAVSVFEWITHLDMLKAVLWVGQILNILAVAALYPIATKVGHGRWAGVAAVLVAGLLSPMPMYYTNWGRYTQLAGQVILPGVIYLAWTTLEKNVQEIESPTFPGSVWAKIHGLMPFDPGGMALTCIILGGLALTHYRILIFAVLFFAAFFLLQINKATWRTLLAGMSWLGIGGGLLFLPWFIHAFAGRIIHIFVVKMSTPVAATSATLSEQFTSIGNISSYLPALLWVFFFLGIVWGLWKRDKGVALISLWSVLLLLAAEPQWLHLPGKGALTSGAVFIAAYIPASVLVGYLVGQVENGSNRTRKTLVLLLCFFVITMGVWGTFQRLRDITSATDLVTQSDLAAMKWIQENTPLDSRFLVNSFFFHGGETIFGTDGGWWLPYLAARQTTLPPLNYAFEQGPRSDYIEWINELTIDIQNKGIAHPDILSLLRERGISFVYFGQRHGQIGAGEPSIFEPVQLLADPSFQLVYQQDRVWIFQIMKVP
jgi:hypothetical protein